MLRNAEFTRPETVRARRPPLAGGPVAKAEMSTADRLGSKGGVEPGRAPAGEGRELLTPWVDERVRSLSHHGAVSFKTHFHRY